MRHYVRVRLDRQGIVRDPETGSMVSLDPRRPYWSDEPIVLAYPDMFASDEQLAAEHQAPVEQATRAPGEKRKYTRRNSKPGDW